MATRVVHVNDNIEGAVYIGRTNRRKGLAQSRLANMYRLNDVWGDRSACIAHYRSDLMYALTQMGSEANHITCDDLIPLRGKPLACWCRHDGEERTKANACHGDVLIELLNRYTDDELRAMGGAV